MNKTYFVGLLLTFVGLLLYFTASFSSFAATNVENAEPGSNNSCSYSLDGCCPKSE